MQKNVHQCVDLASIRIILNNFLAYGVRKHGNCKQNSFQPLFVLSLYLLESPPFSSTITMDGSGPTELFESPGFKVIVCMIFAKLRPHLTYL